MDGDEWFRTFKNAGLYKKDKAIGKEGVTLAGVMLFVKDTTKICIKRYIKVYRE